MRTLALLLLFLPRLVRAEEKTPPAADRIQALEKRLEALESAPGKTSLSAFNPAMGMALDTIFHSVDGKANVDLRAAEVNIEAPIDPFLKGWAVVTGSNHGVDLEEASLETTALPYNLTVRGGRLFADFGRLAHFHDHELPVIDRPRSLDTYVGGEAQGDGIETSFLFPMDQYLNLTIGAFNKLGADNDRQDNLGSRSLYEFTYLARLHTYADLTENHSVDLGLSSAWTPKRFVTDISGPGGASLGIETRRDTWRTLSGVDLTYRYVPVRGGLYNGVVWGTEVLQNDERRFDATRLPTRRVHAYSGYSYVQLKMGLHWRPGVLVDVTEDQDNNRAITRTYTAFLTYDLTEFQRLRLTYARATNNVPGRLRSDTIALQWTGVLGHHVHGFRDR